MEYFWENFIEKETIDDKLFQDSININKNIFINPYIIKNNNEEKYTYGKILLE